MRTKMKKIFIIFMSIFIIGNTFVTDKVYAGGLGEALTVAELLELSGGTAGAATLGSAALGVVVPVLAGAAILYAGYEVATHREEIWSKFQSWYKSSSKVVNDWVDNIASKLGFGELSDGDTIKIPKEVLEASKEWVKQYYATVTGSQMTKIDSTFVDISTLSSEITNQRLIDDMTKNAINYSATSAPLIIQHYNDLDCESIYFCSNAGASSNINTMLIAINSYRGATIQYCNWNNLMSGKQVYGITSQSGLISSAQRVERRYSYLDQQLVVDNVTDCNFGKGDILIDGNKITSASWAFELDLFVPRTCGIVLLNQSYNSDVVLTPDKYKIITQPGLFISTLEPVDTVYNPNYVTNHATGEIALDIPITPDVVGKISTYIDDNTAVPESELISTLDPVGIGEQVIDKPNWLEGLLDGLIGELQNLLEWLFVPDAAKVKAFTEEATDIVESRGGILTYPIELVIKFLNGVNGLGQSDCILKIPRIAFKGYELYGGYSFNFTDYIEQNEFNEAYSVYRTITNFIMIVSVVLLAIKKGEEILTGGLKGD